MADYPVITMEKIAKDFHNKNTQDTTTKLNSLVVTYQESLISTNRSQNLLYPWASLESHQKSTILDELVKLEPFLSNFTKRLDLQKMQEWKNASEIFNIAFTTHFKDIWNHCRRQTSPGSKDLPESHNNNIYISSDTGKKTLANIFLLVTNKPN
jgi:hypothetical protein